MKYLIALLFTCLSLTCLSQSSLDSTEYIILDVECDTLHFHKYSLEHLADTLSYYGIAAVVSDNILVGYGVSCSCFLIYDRKDIKMLYGSFVLPVSQRKTLLIEK